MDHSHRWMVVLLIIVMAISSLFIPMQHNTQNADQSGQMDHSEHMHHH